MIDLSADMGEGSPGEDEIWPLITSANVACGGHVGDADSMALAARTARELGVRLGAHPSYPDRENFGRKSMSMAPAALRASLAAQISALRAVAFDTICIHADMERAVERLRAIRQRIGGLE